MTGSIRTIILDFDETLADTLPGRILAMREAAQQVLGHDLMPGRALEVIQSGSNLESQMASLSNGNSATAEQLIEVYRQRYYRSDRAPLTLFPGMAEVLADLQSSDLRLAVVTSRYRAGANGEPSRGVLWELQRMELEGLFEVIVGYEDSDGHKPSPEPFLICLERLGLVGDAAVAIGDSPFDIQGAQAAGIQAAAALWGSNGPAAILATGPDIVLNVPGDIKTLL